MSLVARLTGLEGLHLGRRVGWLVAGAALSVLLAATVLGFAALALHAVLLRSHDPVQAALMVAGVALLLFAIALSVTLAALRRTRHRARLAVNASLMAAAAPPLASLAFRHAGVTALSVLALAIVLKRRR
jgi:Kef-type K+ transport system membrane component KefB